MKFDIQNEFFQLISKEIKNNRVSHAYLIETNDFLDIDKFINIFAKMLLCENSNYNNDCNKCNICNLIDNCNYPDLKIIEADGNFIKKEQLMEVREDFKSKSVSGGRQVYIIKDASKLNSSSGNTILKFLEEPSNNIIAILLTKSRFNVMETILSRCQIFSLESSTNTYFDDNFYILLETLINRKGFLAFDEIISIIPNREEASKYLNFIEDYFFLYINNDVDVSKKLDLSHFTYDKIYKLILVIEKYLQRLQVNVNYKLMIDNLIIEIDEVVQ